MPPGFSQVCPGWSQDGSPTGCTTLAWERWDLAGEFSSRDAGETPALPGPSRFLSFEIALSQVKHRLPRSKDAGSGVGEHIHYLGCLAGFLKCWLPDGVEMTISTAWNTFIARLLSARRDARPGKGPYEFASIVCCYLSGAGHGNSGIQFRQR